MFNVLRQHLGHLHTTWIKTIQQDPKSSNLSLNEAIDVAQNRPLWRLTFGTTHSKWWMPEMIYRVGIENIFLLQCLYNVHVDACFVQRLSLCGTTWSSHYSSWVKTTTLHREDVYLLIAWVSAKHSRSVPLAASGPDNGDVCNAAILFIWQDHSNSSRPVSVTYFVH